MTIALPILAIQGFLGAFDTLYYHEYRLHLPARPDARLELGLHAARDAIYGIVFLTVGWVAWLGALAWLLAIMLAVEIVITLCDFVQEDRTRALPHGERVNHALMGIVYGVFLAYLVPDLWDWSRQPSGFATVDHGWLAWLLSAMGGGVLASGARDVMAALSLRASSEVTHAPRSG
jgi:hypothetical protein